MDRAKFIYFQLVRKLRCILKKKDYGNTVFGKQINGIESGGV